MWFASNNLCEGPIATPGASSAPPNVPPTSPTVLPLWSSAAALILEAMLCPGIGRLQIPEPCVFDWAGPAHADLGSPAATKATPLPPPPPQGTTQPTGGTSGYPRECRQAGGTPPEHPGPPFPEAAKEPEGYALVGLGGGEPAEGPGPRAWPRSAHLVSWDSGHVGSRLPECGGHFAPALSALPPCSPWH